MQMDIIPQATTIHASIPSLKQENKTKSTPNTN